MTFETPCREWRGPRSPDGYGCRYIRGTNRTRRVHRWIWEQVNGPIPAGMVIMHHCDNPACFRYDHLALGTQADNVADRVAKGHDRIWKLERDHCLKGHRYGDNPRVDRRGARVCRECRRDHQRRYRARVRARSG